MSTLSNQVEVLPEAKELDEPDQQELLCVALAVYHEAKGESQTGKIAVAHVVLNRMSDSRFPQTMCGVVWQRSQFSWTNRPVGALVPRSGEQWDACQHAALDAIQGRAIDPTSGAKFFHARREHSRVHGTRLVLGGHIFIRG